MLAKTIKINDLDYIEKRMIKNFNLVNTIFKLFFLP